jgi:hypothetical protein
MFKKIIRKVFPRDTNCTTNDISLMFSGKSELPYHKEIIGKEETNMLIGNQMKNNISFAVARIGASELKTINNFIAQKITNYNKWNNEIVEEIFTHSGVFPKDEAVLSLFCEIYIEAIKEVDLFGVWNNLGENFLLSFLNEEAILSNLIDLEPFFSVNPWTQYLKGKKVLVIHPFADSINKQYNKRAQLFQDSRILPDFELFTLKAVQSLSAADNRFKNWNDALFFLRSEMENIDFDIAIIGAGAYGLPLAAYAKKMGKISIHLGGATQLLFGIKGKRWEERSEYANLINEYWIYPSEEEKPPYGDKVDGTGPYWA